MGWWKIKDVASGQIAWDHQAPGDNPGLVNAIPGEDPTVDLYNGDGPADIMGAALREVNKEYVEAWGREATTAELKAVFNFCLGGVEVDLEDKAKAKQRLKYLRGEIEAERISMSEIAELQGLVEYIDPGDVLLLEWAGVPENVGGHVSDESEANRR